MSEHVRKIIPYELFEIDAIEGWLDRLAQQGLMLESITLRFAKFKKSEPATVRHRVDINTYQKEQLTDELHAYYEECGWRHIATFSCGKFSVYRAQNNAATELHTDLAVLNQALRRTAIGQLILAIVFYGYAAWISVGMYRYFISGGVMQSLLHDGVKLLCCAALAIILALTCGTVNLLAFIRLRRRQKSGAILAHKGYAQVRANVKVGIVIAITVIAAFTLVMLASGFDHYEEHPLTEYTHALAFPLWKDIAPDEWDAVQSCRTDTNFHEFSNYIMIRHSYFAPNILMTRQEGIRAEVKEGGFERLPAYSVSYYEMRSEKYAVKLVRELAEETAYGTFFVTEAEGFDFVACNSFNGAQELILRSDNIVIEVWYTGKADLLEYIPLFLS